MKRVLGLVMAAVICFAFCACGSNQGGSAITYSNLVNEEELTSLESLLKDNGVNETAAEKVVSSVRAYNETIGSDLLTSEGTIDVAAPIPEYDSVKIDEMWLAKNEMFVGYNCRLTAFELMKDFITVKDTSKSNPFALFMDEDALNYSEDGYLTDEELAKFEAVYSTIATTSSTDPQEQYEIQKKYWEEIGVSFSNSDKISLISVYLHNHFSEEENELLIGHTGVLVSTDDGYLFFEKLSFQLPYQMIHFGSKEELKDYLLAAYDTDTTGECAKPFILENDVML